MLISKNAFVIEMIGRSYKLSFNDSSIEFLATPTNIRDMQDLLAAAKLLTRRN